MTKGQFLFLEQIKRLDDIQLGCLSVGVVPNADHIESQLLVKGWIRSEKRHDCWERVMTLTTKGLRAFNREAQKRA